MYKLYISCFHYIHISVKCLLTKCKGSTPKPQLAFLYVFCVFKNTGQNINIWIFFYFIFFFTVFWYSTSPPKMQYRSGSKKCWYSISNVQKGLEHTDWLAAFCYATVLVSLLVSNPDTVIINTVSARTQTEPTKENSNLTQKWLTAKCKGFSCLKKTDIHHCLKAHS